MPNRRYTAKPTLGVLNRPDLQDAAPPAAEPETDIGPDLPEDAPAEPETAPSDVGPELPEKCGDIRPLDVIKTGDRHKAMSAIA